MSRTTFFHTLVFTIIFSAILALHVSLPKAQTTPEGPAPEINQDQRIQGWRAQLDQISSAIKRDGISDQEVVNFRRTVLDIQDAAQSLSDELTPEIQSLNSRLETLKQAANASLVPAITPADEGGGAEETDATNADAADDETNQAQPTVESTSPTATSTQELSQSEIALNAERAELEASIQKLNAQLGRAQVILLRAKELLADISDLRRSRFTNEILGRASSILSPSLWLKAVSELPGLGFGLYSIIDGGLKRVWADAPLIFISSLLLGILLSYGLLRHLKPLRLTSTTRVKKDGKVKQVGYGQGINALRRVVRSFILIVLTPGLVLYTITQADVVGDRLSVLLWALFSTVSYFALARGLSLAILSPANMQLRLADIDDKKAWTLHRQIMTCLIISLLGFTVYKFAQILVASQEVILLAIGLTSTLFGGSALLNYVFRDKSEDPKERLIPNILILKILSVFVLVGLVMALVAPILGYPTLGAFAVEQTILAGVISAIIYIAFRFIDALFGMEPNQPQDGVPIIKSSDSTSQRRAQAILLISGFAKVMLTLLGVMVFAASWGLDTSSIWDDIARLFTEIKIGELTISPATILTALIVLVIGVLTTRALQRWFSNRFLPTTNLDVGLRNSITTAIGYIGFIVSAMIAFSQAGLDLSNLAIVAGALSLGIGFGLQSIVSNFVSGIILLAERPIKAGDWISVGGSEGTVKKISVRSTEIETFDRATVIMPNADFISGSVKNFMYGNTIGRFIVTVGVGYDSNPQQVKNILLECAKNHPLVLAYPESYVIFSEFGASSLDFELRGYLADCGNGLSVRSDLRFAIFQRLKEEGIEIPFPQQDVYIKNLSRDDIQKEIELDERAPEKSAPTPEPRPEPVTMRRDEIETSGDVDGK